MKVLHVLNHSLPHTDGYSVRSSQIIQAQRSNGIEVVVCTSPKHEPVPTGEVEEIGGIRHYRASRPVGSWVPYVDELFSMRCLRDRLAQVIEAESPDVVHAHSPCHWGASALRVCRRYGLPLVYEIRAFWEDCLLDKGVNPRWSAKYRVTRALESWVTRKADAVTVIATHLKNDLLARGISDEKIFVVPNGVDIDRFKPGGNDEQLRTELGLNGHVCIGYLGSLFAWEGVDDLLRAMIIVARQNPNVKLLIVGGGQEQAALNRLIEENQLGDCVRMQGHVAHSDVLRYYSIMDVMVYPRKRSRVTELVTPLKPLEALAMGKPVVASDVGGLRELLGDNGALYCAPDDPADLATKCLRFLEVGPRERMRIGAEGRDYVEKNKSWSTITRQYDRVYEFARQRRPSNTKRPQYTGTTS